MEVVQLVYIIQVKKIHIEMPCILNTELNNIVYTEQNNREANLAVYSPRSWKDSGLIPGSLIHFELTSMQNEKWV